MDRITEPRPRVAPAVRAAGPDDAEELVRLRAIMLDSLNPGQNDSSWQPASVAILRRELAGPGGDLAAFVVDVPGRPGVLAACVVGTVNQGLGSPGNESGLGGHVFSVATDPAMRRRGYSRACMEALLDWYRGRGVRKVDLHASDEGAPLYASLGFVPNRAAAMRLLL
ncbi:GNAT family N-acetyltransferase [Streptomyces sp. 8L]|uniref:GNAT family N-acetyltransferase n=1 Tax=Streptomyces sp. 8L TaxID=2877242 RepID=UPI001CD7A6B2|nr:GNAT family N-acetyltransferase [Streptomyces sp. 8L]MCA1220504.1 GNAT family N-acetyltransferase [Streptomyces sp. 8L]